MEGSFVRLKIAEKEERLKIDLEKKNQKPVNGIVQKDGKYYLVRLEMELEKLKSMINEAESDQRVLQLPEEGESSLFEESVYFIHFHTFVKGIYWY